MSLTCVNGTELLFKNPYTFKPQGFEVINTTLTSGGPALGVQAFKLNTSRTDGQLGLTVEYQPPYGLISLERQAAQSIPSGGSGTEIAWDYTDTQAGALTLIAGGDIDCAEAGFVEATCFASFDAGAVGERSLWISNGTIGGIRYASANGQPPATAATPVHLTVAALIRVTAGLNIQANLLQSSGGTSISTSTGNYTPRFVAKYVAPPAAYKAIVTGILWAR